MFDRHKIPAICLAISLTVFAAGCNKRSAPIAPPPPMAAPAPNGGGSTPVAPAPAAAAPVVAQFSAEPTSILIGQSSTLRWQVTGDTSSVTIDQTIGTALLAAEMTARDGCDPGEAYRALTRELGEPFSDRVDARE